MACPLPGRQTVQGRGNWRLGATPVMLSKLSIFPTLPIEAMKRALASYANQVKPLIRMETVLANEIASGKSPLTQPESDTVLYALALAKLHTLHADGRDVLVDQALGYFRERIVDAFRPIMLDNHGAIDYYEMGRLIPALHDEIVRMEERLLQTHVNDFSRAHLEDELTRKELVLVLGGGGGSGYVYLGAFAALEEAGILPSYMVGSSMGAIMGALRGTMGNFDIDVALNILKGLRWRDVFRFMTMENRYGLPATLRLHLQATMQHHFLMDDLPMRLDQLTIPTEVVVAGIKLGGLPHEPSYYEGLLDLGGVRGPLQVAAFRKRIGRMYDSIRELLMNPSVLHELVMGRDPLTHTFDVIDAVGFSSAIPGVIHYDVIREDPRMHSILQAVMAKHGLARLVDGGVVANVPARTAWLGVQEGKIKRRNTFILALDSFAPGFNANMLFAPIQHLVQQNVKRDRPYAHQVKAFHDVLSPLNLVPRYDRVVHAVVKGKRSLERDMAFVRTMMTPIQAPSAYRAQGLTFGDPVVFT